MNVIIPLSSGAVPCSPQLLMQKPTAHPCWGLRFGLELVDSKSPNSQATFACFCPATAKL